jgi:hypothetical protein
MGCSRIHLPALDILLALDVDTLTVALAVVLFTVFFVVVAAMRLRIFYKGRKLGNKSKTFPAPPLLGRRCVCGGQQQHVLKLQKKTYLCRR